MTALTITTDEDQTTGYMLDDEHTPKTLDERLAMFCLHAAREWDMVVDPRKLHGGERRGFMPYDEDMDCMRVAYQGETPESYWFVFEDLDEAAL